MAGDTVETILALTKDLPPSNYIGATIFWLYIVAALALTAIVLKTICSLPRPQNGFNPQAELATNVFSGLATLSFAVLSCNMLNVLIRSYQAWHPLYKVRGDSSFQSIWTWSMTSTLFRDFGEAILASQARYFWTIISLFGTMAVFNYMGVEGPRKRIPNLWAFFALSQILPISFAQNLFYLAMIRQPDGGQAITVRPALYATILMAYSTGLAMAQQTSQTWALMPLIAAARFLLFGQYFVAQKVVGTPSSAVAKRMQMPLAVMATLVVGRQLLIALAEQTLGQVLEALTSHPAVSSLGVDFLFSALSLIVWRNISIDSQSRKESRKQLA